MFILLHSPKSPKHSMMTAKTALRPLIVHDVTKSNEFQVCPCMGFKPARTLEWYARSKTVRLRQLNTLSLKREETNNTKRSLPSCSCLKTKQGLIFSCANVHVSEAAFPALTNPDPCTRDEAPETVSLKLLNYTVRPQQTDLATQAPSPTTLGICGMHKLKTGYRVSCYFIS